LLCRLVVSHPSIVPIGWLLLPFAAIGIAGAHRLIRSWFIIVFAVSIVSFAWYAHIDVAPRFLYHLLPFYFIYAGAGLQCSWSRFKARGSQGRFAFSVIGCALVLALLLWGLGCLYFHASWSELGMPQMAIEESEQETLTAIQEVVPHDSVLCMGPSHEMNYYWVINRKMVFVPTYENMEEFREYLERFHVEYVLIDTSVIARNLPLLGAHFTWDPWLGIVQTRDIDCLQPMFQNGGAPLRFILYRIVGRTQQAQMNEGS